MVYRLTIAGLFWVSASASAYAGANPNFTLPLHAKVSQFEPCTGYLPVDCMGVRPTVQVESGQPVTIFLFVANYTQIAGLQTAFEVDPSWTYAFGLWDCTPTGFFDVSPFPPFGPTHGTLSGAFLCVTSGSLLPIGRMFFVAGTGCVGQVESSFPHGIHAMDCQQEYDRILPDEPGQRARLGKVCVGPGGHDPCAEATTVAAATWGRIKATY
jgi:hypothetical protein